jgi:uncharacterized protein (DUF2236 family)
MSDPGYFGPDSITWEVNRELTVLFGGARALLMHAAHPLIAAGARQTSMYSRDPWARLIRTLMLQSTVTFGSKAEAQEAADKINKLHLKVNGIDPVTGGRYDALDHDQLLWVHAALEVSSLYFFERTVRKLTPDERQRYHTENLIAAELILLPREHVPSTYEEMEAYVDEMVHSDTMLLTDVAQDVADIISSGPVPRGVKWMWGFISYASFGTLPRPLKELYGVKWGPWRQRWLDFNLAMLGRIRPFLPQRFRLIGPAQIANRRMAGDTDIRIIDRMRSAQKSSRE